MISSRDSFECFHMCVFFVFYVSLAGEIYNTADVLTFVGAVVKYHCGSSNMNPVLGTWLQGWLGVEACIQF